MPKTIEERVDELELILGEIMTQTGIALRRIERSFGGIVHELTRTTTNENRILSCISRVSRAISEGETMKRRHRLKSVPLFRRRKAESDFHWRNAKCEFGSIES